MIGSILMFVAYSLYYELAWNKILPMDSLLLENIFLYGVFIGASLVNWGLAVNEADIRKKYLIYNTLSVFFFSLFLVYGFQDMIIYVFESEKINEVLKGFNKLMITIILTTLSCISYHFYQLKRS